MMKIHETADGAATHLESATRLVSEEGSFELPEGAIDAVMRRYGKEVEPSEPLMDVARLDLGDSTLRHVRHRAMYDVIALDYLLYERPGEPGLIAMATTVAGALRYLGR